LPATLINQSNFSIVIILIIKDNQTQFFISFAIALNTDTPNSVRL
jgi:hypothetical protein